MSVLLHGTAIILVIGLLDYSLGARVSSYVFYFIPILFVTAYGGMRAGLATSLIAATVWLLSDHFSGAVYPSKWIFYWNTLVRLLSFAFVATMQHFIGRERYLARTDFLTKLANSQYFYEVAENELCRSIRYQIPLTIAYLDLDHFKQVNDRKGHIVGNRLLRAVGKILKENVRDVDTAARLGGDEFAVILPQADEAAAEGVMLKLQTLLNEGMQQNGWEVTFSIGVTTFHHFPSTVNEMVRVVDRCMYTVKNGGKNGIKFEVVNPPSEQLQ